MKQSRGGMSNGGVSCDGEQTRATPILVCPFTSQADGALAGTGGRGRQGPTERPWQRRVPSPGALPAHRHRAFGPARRRAVLPPAGCRPRPRARGVREARAGHVPCVQGHRRVHRARSGGAAGERSMGLQCGSQFSSRCHVSAHTSVSGNGDGTFVALPTIHCLFHSLPV